MQRADQLVAGAALAVRVARVVNRLFFAAVVAALAATLLVPDFFATILVAADPALDVANALTGVRLVLLIGVVMAVATDRLLNALGAIVASAADGDPFVPGNAMRLHAAAWALLVLQLLDLPCLLLARYWPSLGTAAPLGDVSVGGWLATLLLFVLARVFAAGTMMRDELAATV